MLSVSFSEILQFAVFKFNQENIVAAFCINKEKPSMKCDGKCYLNKKISQSTEENKSTPISPPDEKSLIVFFEALPTSDDFNHALERINWFTYLEPASSIMEKDIAHPPEIHG